MMIAQAKLSEVIDGLQKKLNCIVGSNEGSKIYSLELLQYKKDLAAMIEHIKILMVTGNVNMDFSDYVDMCAEYNTTPFRSLIRFSI